MPGRVLKFVLESLDAATARLGVKGAARPEHLTTGSQGEEAAFFHLRGLGYVIVARNWRSRRRRGEIDLIGWDGPVLCFVEVKTRSTRAVKPAEAAVDEDKRRELLRMAGEYMRRLEAPPPFRFDVVSVYTSQEGDPEITLFRDAFRMA